MADCLSNALVLRKILENFSSFKLLRLSLVSKLWNNEARSVMKHRGNLNARLRFRDYRPCAEYLDAFAADLRCMNVIPFSGLRIHLEHSHSTCQATPLQFTHETIFCKLQLKSVSVELNGEWCKNKVCPGSLLAKKVLQHFSGVLEQVSLIQVSCRKGSLIVGFMTDFNFPRLKILKVGEFYYGENEPRQATTLKALVAGAPALQELHTPGPINLMLNVLEGRSAILVYQSYVSAPFDEIPDNFINKIRLEKIKLHHHGPSFNVERFNRITPVLLQVSCLAIKSMEINPLLAVCLMCYGISFENVRHLTMYINPGQMELHEPRVLRILKQFDFARTFPNLKDIRIFPPYTDRQLPADHVNGFVEQAHGSLEESGPDRAINIQELNLLPSIWSAPEFYAEMFPHIERLSVKQGDGAGSLGSIWKHWVHLKKLDVVTEVQKHHEDLDSVICGIFPEEATELRRKDEEFLKKVNIVPVMPAMTCLRNLREFTLLLEPGFGQTFGFPSPRHVKPPTSLILSKVAGLVAFARCPNLTAIISAQSSQAFRALRHMKPYVCVLYLMPHAAV